MHSSLRCRLAAKVRFLSDDDDSVTHYVVVAGVVLATGTPMKNGRPQNLFPLLLAIQHPLGNDQVHTLVCWSSDIDLKLEFERRFCGARKTGFGWDCRGV